METGCGNFCQHVGVTDRLMQQEIFHLQTEQPWNVSQCFFHFCYLDEPHNCPWTARLSGKYFSHWKMRLHFTSFYTSLQFCAPFTGALWWFVAFSRYNKYLHYLPTHKERQQQMMNARDSKCMWEWTQRLLKFQSLNKKNTITRRVCASLSIYLKEIKWNELPKWDSVNRTRKT